MIRGLILAIALLAATSAEAEQRRHDLKGVREMKYQGIFEDTTARCEIDRRAWNTSIDFVANQSSKLKFWREVDHMAQEQTRHDRVMALEVDLGDVESKRRWDQEWDKLTKFGYIPNLYFDLISIDVKKGMCWRHKSNRRRNSKTIGDDLDGELGTHSLGHYLVEYGHAIGPVPRVLILCNSVFRTNHEGVCERLGGFAKSALRAEHRRPKEKKERGAQWGIMMVM